MNGNLAAALARRAELFGWLDRPLFHTGDTVHTHAAVHGAAARASGVLHAAGVRAGHRVMVALPDSLDLASALLGTLRLGAVAVLVGPEQTHAQHAYVRDDASPAAVICPSGLTERFPGVQVLTPGDLSDEPTTIPPPEPVSPDAPAYVQYTSGTTGSPKGVVHRHSDARAYVEALALGALGLNAEDLVFSTSKACYAYGLGNTILFPMHIGAAAILWPGSVGPGEISAVARRYGPTLLFGAPRTYARLVEQGDPIAFGSLRAAAVAGEPLLPHLADRVEAFLGCPLLDGLGTTEVGHTFISNTVSRRLRGSLGVALSPYQIEVRAGHGRRASVGEQGLLYVQGPSVLLEYLDRPEKTAEALDAEGWLCTGDLVHLDDDGFVHHHGRAADLEIVGGVSVTPLETERVLGEHPAVGEVAVVGDGVGGLRAYVAPRLGHMPTPALGALLREYARARMRREWVPETVTLMASLPRTDGGKIDRALLRRPRPIGAYPSAANAGPTLPDVLAAGPVHPTSGECGGADGNGPPVGLDAVRSNLAS